MKGEALARVVFLSPRKGEPDSSGAAGDAASSAAAHAATFEVVYGQSPRMEATLGLTIASATPETLCVPAGTTIVFRSLEPGSIEFGLKLEPSHQATIESDVFSGKRTYEYLCISPGEVRWRDTEFEVHGVIEVREPKDGEETQLSHAAFDRAREARQRAAREAAAAGGEDDSEDSSGDDAEEKEAGGRGAGEGAGGSGAAGAAELSLDHQAAVAESLRIYEEQKRKRREMKAGGRK